MDTSNKPTKRPYAERVFRLYKYRLTYTEDGQEYRRLFMNKADLGEFIGVSVTTVTRWLHGCTDMKLLARYNLEKVRVPAQIKTDRTRLE